MAKRLVVLVGVIALSFVVASALRSSVSAQATGRTIPVTGIVVNGTGIPVAGTHVLLMRRHWAADYDGSNILAEGDTDATGSFSFGSINLHTEIQFPIEVGVALEYRVKAPNGLARTPVSIEFTAPRSGQDYAVASVYAKLTVN